MAGTSKGEEGWETGKAFDQNKMYVVEGIALQYVRSVMKRLYRVDFERMERRHFYRSDLVSSYL